MPVSGFQGSDMEAMDAALTGPDGWMHGHNTGSSPQQLAAPIRALVEAKRREAERVRHIAIQYEDERGPNDAGTMEAQDIALQAEAEVHGAAAVERALESAAQGGQATQQIAMTVEVFDDEKQRAEVAWHEAQGRFGDNHNQTIAAHTAMLQAAFAWQGAMAAQSAPAMRGFETAEHPQAIANRASAASESYRAEAEELRRKADLLARKHGKTDVRAKQALKAADEADAKAQSALFEEESAQAVADGRPPPRKPAKKKVNKKVQRSIC